MEKFISLKEAKEMVGSHIFNSERIFRVEQALFKQTFGVSLDECIKKDLFLTAPMSDRFSSDSMDSIRQNFKVQEIKDKDLVESIKQTANAPLMTSTGTQAFLLNKAASQYFGGNTGVFAPTTILELQVAKSRQLFRRLYGLQPFNEGDLAGDVFWVVKPNPWGDAGAPVFARTAEGRAGKDIAFQVANDHFAAQRYIVHMPYSYELKKILAKRIALGATISELFNEAKGWKDDWYIANGLYEALTAGTLEGGAYKPFTDGTLADVDGHPAQYCCFYDTTLGTIKSGDSESYDAATEVAVGEKVFSLAQYVIQVMRGTSPYTGASGRDYRHRWTPEWMAVPSVIANKLVADFQAGETTNVWVAANNIPGWSNEEGFLGRLTLGGGKGIDVWEIPMEITSEMAKVTTDSPTRSISPMFFGKYFGTGAICPATPTMMFVDEGFEVVTDGSSVATLRRNGTQVETMLEMECKRPTNISTAFLVKVVTTA